MTIVFPPELINEVISYCCNESLTKCALVNKMFLNRARVHLYYAIEVTSRLQYAFSCPSTAQMFTHTMHVELRSYDLFLVREIHRLRRLQTLKILYWGDAEEYSDILLQLLSLPTLRRFTLSIYMRLTSNSIIPPGLVSLLASPKLQDLFTVTHGRQVPLPLLPMHKLDTLRAHIYSQHFFNIDWSVLRRLSLTIIHPANLHTIETHINNWFTSTSHHLTHLALNFKSDTLTQGDSPHPPSIIFAGLAKFTSLVMLTLDIDIHPPEMSFQLDYLCLLLQQVSTTAPLCTIHIILQWLRFPTSNSFDPMHPSWAKIPKTVKDRFPDAQLFLYFDIFNNGDYDRLLPFEIPQHLPGVDKISYKSGCCRRRPFFPTKCTEDFIHY